MRSRIPSLFSLRIVALVLVLTVSGACERGPVRVLLLGDSITRGLVSDPAGPSYAELLSSRLAPAFQVRIAACGGTTAGDWTPDAPPHRCARLPEGESANLYTARVEPELPIDVAVVLLGTNDAWGRGRAKIPLVDYETDLRSIVAGLQASGVEHVMLIRPPGVHYRADVFMRLWRQGQSVSRICAEVDGVVCGPDLLTLLGREDFGVENVHPNGAGHAKIAQALADDLLELVAED